MNDSYPSNGGPELDDDFFSLDEKKPSERGAEIERLVREYLEKDQELSDLNEKVSAVNKAINKLKTDSIPSLLNEIGTDVWQDKERGVLVELETAVNSTLPKDQEKRNAILDALRSVGVEEIMTEAFEVSFPPGDIRAEIVRRFLGLDGQVLEGYGEEDGAEERPALTNEQLDLIQRLRETLGTGAQFPAKETLGVNGNRFKSWLKKRIDSGYGTMISEAGIWHGTHAKVKLGKGKK